MGSWMMVVPPQAHHGSRDRWHCYRPTDQSCHAKTEPDSLLTVLLHAELAGSLCTNLLDKVSVCGKGLIRFLIGHFQTPPDGPSNHSPSSRPRCERCAPVRPVSG